MNTCKGFTLVELIIFIVISGILGSTILLGLNQVSRKSPTVEQQVIATATAVQCMEWFLGQRRSNRFSSLPCPSSSVPAFCSTPTGYTLSASISCTTLNSDTQYKTITVTVSGLADATVTSLIGDY
jgi:prepilin-type N-terminal cleavage/methylation domain-containing protein